MKKQFEEEQQKIELQNLELAKRLQVKLQSILLKY